VYKIESHCTIKNRNTDFGQGAPDSIPFTGVQSVDPTKYFMNADTDQHKYIDLFQFKMV